MVDDLTDVLDALREWQYDGAPMQLHPGDLGWFWRFGVDATAAAVRTWRRDGRILAVGLLDSPRVLRLTIAPSSLQDEDLAHELLADITSPSRGVLLAGEANVDARTGALLQTLLADAGWGTDEPWTPLHLPLAAAVPDPGLRIGVIGPENAHVRSAVQRASFDSSTFTDDRWHAMAAGPAYADARCLVAHDEADTPVAAVTVWSAGPGKPGLLEPLGVHGDHRGQGHGKAITLAAAAALRELGSSTAVVCTPTAHVAGVATYISAGFHPLPEIRDRRRES